MRRYRGSFAHHSGACDCTLTELMEQAKSTLQGLAVDAGNFEQVAGAAYELSVLIRYGSIRRIETDTLVPLLQQLFLRGTLLLVDSAGCNDDAAQGMVRAIQSLHTIAQDHFEAVDDGLWLNKLQELASRDDRNAKLSGFAFAILLERNEIPDERVATEVSRRLSPGIPVDLGAGWFEGMSMRNRYALLSRNRCGSSLIFISDRWIKRHSNVHLCFCAELSVHSNRGRRHRWPR